MKMQSKFALMAGAASAVLLISAGAALAQDATPQSTPAQEGEAAQVEDIVVVGSQIRGASTTAALPVTVVTQEEIIATGAVSGDDLLRSIPQMGDVLFSSANNPQTSNAARGDVNSVNLRSLGVGNTLVLLNGRRIVQHPTSQGTSDTGTVPVLSYNSNAIPVSGLERLEVLLDGAAAIYGADAVAGVVNTVLQQDFDGLEMKAQYGGAEGTHRREFTFGMFAGKDFERGNLSGFLDYTNRTAQQASDEPYTASDDRRSLFANVPGYENSTDTDGRSSYTAWANFQTPFQVRRGTTALTTGAGAFHNQPSSFGCTAPVGGDVCLASGNISYSGAGRELRYDAARGTTQSPDIERLNLFVSGHYDLDNGVTAFGELGYYTASTQNIQPPTILLNPLWIPASNYWNPFGPVTFADGTRNPNRLAGLTNVPTAGTAVKLVRYRFNDLGAQVVDVDNWQSRFLGGLRGEWRGFDWESALLYSEAEATDSSNAVNLTALQANLALSTPDAYNPFSGGCVNDTSFGDCTPSSQAAIDAITTDLTRVSKTTLALWDFKVSRPDVFTLPGGPVGMALGVEARRETQRDDRDADLDGTNVFRDSVSGEISQSNIAAVSSNPDTYGKREVYSAYVEFAVPVVSPEMNIPLVRSLDFQLAGRYEHYSDFGDVAKPKIAMAWDLVEGVRVRGSYSEGFRAPNLEQTNAAQYGRLSTNNDYIRCEADLRLGRITNFNQCSQPASASLLVSGNPELQPEESRNQSIGLVLQPWFIPEQFGRFTFTLDRWKIEQEKIVGLLGAQSNVVLDYLNILNGTRNDNVNRAAVTADDIAFFQGSGITPVGQIVSVEDQFINLLPQTVEGLDIGLQWRLRGTPWGNFRASVNAAHLTKFDRSPGPLVESLFAAREAGQINANTPLPISQTLLARNGRPEWRVTGSFTWSQGPWQVGAFTQYNSAVTETGFLSAQGDPWQVDSQITGNLYGQYEFGDNAGFASGTTVRLGARNITDEQPPLTSSGYLGALYNPYGRYWYANISKTF
ncbi:MAG: outer membrane receptor protein involved in Fe transport [Brevundimonas sp.]|jgi:iron complex outermembrane receptor protein|uniref:TonB-dependent receptor domain-containing protein n=1 Tax=Brevundimonas sp. GW460-12-10-14-LB2 TaxID=1827469 RepID=UPI0007BC9285|nr:TonB-dependent receptor [Brevundimonas sp. GW460-12-10-14-LB2]ANC52974.1 TonB-dependent receptor [Brevundimonas sp. GW460-12-10-14-LB2]MEA3473352.1 TonB-dependent receptor [Pseudomonadota bacterium]